MIGDKFEKQASRHMLAWKLENHDLPIIMMKTPNPDAKPFENKTYKDSRAAWFDVENVIKRERAKIENTCYLGDAIPRYMPNLGPDVFAAFTGCELDFSPTTSWAIHNVEDWDELADLKINRDNIYYKTILDLTKAALEDSKGDYMVTVTDLHPGLDALVSLRGPENLCFDLYENPDGIKKFTWQFFDLFKEYVDESNALLRKYQKGSLGGWMDVYNDNDWYLTSCDFSCLISPDAYKEFVLPELVAELEYVGNSIYHLDGPDAMAFHLDTLLNIPQLNGIQWVYGSGSAPAREWIPQLQKMQAAGKMIHIDVTPEDIRPLCENLNPEGLILNAWAPDPDTGKNLIKMAEDIYKNK